MRFLVSVAVAVVMSCASMAGCEPQQAATEPSGAARTPECKMGSNGHQTCGYNCKLGSDGAWYCASTPDGKCALNAGGSWSCP